MNATGAAFGTIALGSGAVFVHGAGFAAGLTEARGERIEVFALGVIAAFLRAVVLLPPVVAIRGVELTATLAGAIGQAFTGTLVAIS